MKAEYTKSGEPISKYVEIELKPTPITIEQAEEILDKIHDAYHSLNILDDRDNRHAMLATALLGYASTEIAILKEKLCQKLLELGGGKHD